MWTIFYWVSSLFLYVAAIAPLTSMSERAQEFFGFLEGLVFFLGILMFRSKSLHGTVVNASMRIDAKGALVMNFLSTISLLMLIFILCAYYMKWKKGWRRVALHELDWFAIRNVFLLTWQMVCI
jgi:hypothetical protein